MEWVLFLLPLKGKEADEAQRVNYLKMAQITSSDLLPALRPCPDGKYLLCFCTHDSCGHPMTTMEKWGGHL